MIFEFVQMFKSTKSCRTDLLKVKFGITPEKGCKMTQVGGWGHLMVQINPPFRTHRFPMKLEGERGERERGRRRPRQKQV